MTAGRSLYIKYFALKEKGYSTSRELLYLLNDVRDSNSKLMFPYDGTKFKLNYSDGIIKNGSDFDYATVKVGLVHNAVVSLGIAIKNEKPFYGRATNDEYQRKYKIYFLIIRIA